MRPQAALGLRPSEEIGIARPHDLLKARKTTRSSTLRAGARTVRRRGALLPPDRGAARHESAALPPRRKQPRSPSRTNPRLSWRRRNVATPPRPNAGTPAGGIHDERPTTEVCVDVVCEPPEKVARTRVGRRRAVHAFVALFAVITNAQAGTWPPSLAFNHPPNPGQATAIEPIHGSVLPTPWLPASQVAANARVLVFGYDGGPFQPNTKWAVFLPEAAPANRFLPNAPNNIQKLMNPLGTHLCGSHGWLPSGNLILAGGSTAVGRLAPTAPQSWTSSAGRRGRGVAGCRGGGRRSRSDAGIRPRAGSATTASVSSAGI